MKSMNILRGALPFNVVGAPIDWWNCCWLPCQRELTSHVDTRHFSLQHASRLLCASIIIVDVERASFCSLIDAIICFWCSKPYSSLVGVLIHHQKYKRKKFYGWSINNEHSFVLGEQIIAALNNDSTVLLPFTVDPHGGIGPLASRFLFGTTSDPSPPPLMFRWQIAQQAYKNTISDACLPLSCFTQIKSKKAKSRIMTTFC
jgi:hypothetical protein